MKLKLKKALAIAGVFITLSPVLMDTGVLPSAVNKAYVLAETYYSYAPTDEDCKPVVTSLSDKKKDTSTSSKTSSSGASKSTSNTDFTEGALKWYHDHEGKVSYSQEVRDGPSSYDCSSSLYYALREAGATDNGYAVSTETEHQWLKDNGYDLIAEGRDTDKTEFQEGDIFIWGEIGKSSGSGGHTGIFVDDETVIHCSKRNEGIAENQYLEYKASTPHKDDYVYIYRSKNAKPKTKTKKSKKDKKDKKDNKDSKDNKTESKSDKSSKSESSASPKETSCAPKCDDGKNTLDSTNTNSSNKTSSAGAGSLSETIDKFVKEHEEAYILSWKAGGFLPSASIVQTIAETSFSESVPSFGQAHNMGGVKFSGQEYPATKKLYGNDAVSGSGAGTSVGDNTGGSYAYFKSYDAGIVGKAEFMANQSLYDGAINNTDGKKTLDAIADGGWATDPSYKTKLNELYDTYGSQYKWLDEKAIAKYGDKPFSKEKAKGDDKGSSSSKDGDKDKSSDVSCETNYKSSGGDGWQKAGGNSGYTSDMYWKRGDLPKELKQYAIDPESVGMAWHDSKGWDGAGPYLSNGITNQCTTLAAALFGALWEKDGKALGSAHGARGHGVAMVGQVVETMGTKDSKEPTSGDMVSMTPNHVAIVSHVFENGDILLCEQNVLGYSGEGNGESYSWSYSYITKASQKVNNYHYTNPSEKGYKVTSKAKALG